MRLQAILCSSQWSPSTRKQRWCLGWEQGQKRMSLWYGAGDAELARRDGQCRCRALSVCRVQLHAATIRREDRRHLSGERTTAVGGHDRLGDLCRGGAHVGEAEPYRGMRVEADTADMHCPGAGLRERWGRVAGWHLVDGDRLASAGLGGADAVACT